MTEKGAVCFTFDDANFQQWIDALPLWEKYNAHASFFVSGEITSEAMAAMKKLRVAGHTVGLHTLSHKDAPAYFAEHGGEAYIENEIMPQLEVCLQNDFPIKHLAYPNNAHDEETDKLLSGYFHHFRAGAGGRMKDGFCIYDPYCVYCDRDDPPAVLRGTGIGEYYATRIEDIDKALEGAAAEKKLVVFFSHGISADASGVSMKTAWLEHCLEKASALGLDIISFDELP